MSNDLNVLLVGYGLAGKVFHAPLILATPGYAIRGVVTRDAERTQQALIDIPGVGIYASLEEALSRSPEIDVVVIANANRAHVRDAHQGIAAGKHVVVDKPLAGSALEAQELAQAALDAGVQLHPFQNRRWDSDFRTLKNVISDGQLGTIHRFESRFERLRVTPRGNWRESNDVQDLGGVLLDFGAHLVDQAIQLLGTVIGIDAYARSIRQPDSADDDMQIILTHESGAISLLTGSQVSAFPDPRFLLLGSRGAVRIAESDTQETHLRAGRAPIGSGWGQESFTAEMRIGNEDGTQTVSELPLVPGSWPHFYAAVRDAIIKAGEPPVAPNEVIANLRVLDAARLSVKSGQRVILSPPASH